MPRVSVIIPTYNRKDYVQEAIDSVLAQTYTDYEIIVVDDGSTDGTGEALQARYGDRVRYVWQENQGESVARNRAVDMSTGTYLALLDSDDSWMPTKLAVQLEMFDISPDVAAVCSDAWLVDANGVAISSRTMRSGLAEDALTPASLCLENPIINSSALMSRFAFEHVGGYDMRLHYGEDWDLWLRMAMIGTLKYIAQPLVMFRQHAVSQNQFPSQARAQQLLEDRLAMLEKAFVSAPDQIPPEVVRESKANQYVEAAFVNYGVGDGSRGKQYLEHALKICPEQWLVKKRLMEQLCHFAFLAIAAAGYHSSIPGEHCLDTAFAYWPDAVRFSEKEMQKARGQLLAQFAFYRANTGYDSQVTSGDYFFRAIKYDPSLLRNRGVLSHLSSSIRVRASNALPRYVKQR